LSKRIATGDAPQALGPYSQGIDDGAYVFVSGQVGVDPATGKTADGIAAQAEQALANVGAVLRASGCGWSDVVKVTLWLTDAAHFSVVNDIYARVVGDPPPARSAPIVAGIPRGFLISVEAVAKKP
jgi:2-iminobutanoate/2-iminopropanoate deaminase